MKLIYRICTGLRRPMSWLLYGFALIALIFLLMSFSLSSNPQFIKVQFILVNVSMGYFLAYWMVRWIARKFSFDQVRNSILDLIFLVIGYLIPNPPLYPMYLVGRQFYLATVATRIVHPQGRLYRRFTANPAIVMLLTFIFTIVAGTFLLMLPFASVTHYTPFIDALFTSTSATCVTGLTVLDTGGHFTLFGQIVILLLIQIGGLGLMTVSTAFAIALGQHVTLRSGDVLQNMMGESNRHNTFRLLRGTIGATLAIEAVGAAILYLAFPHRNHAIFNAVFHSVSAFCNAGFGLYPNNYMDFVGNDVINFTTMGLIILGGIGFSVITDVNRNIVSGFRPSRLSLHTKIVLITTVSLIVLGFIAYFIAEYNNTMRDFNLHDRCLASLFQSVTTRTAGFNSIDNAQLTDASVLISLFLMFVGASPGSTGGGVKTTTLAVLVLTVWSIMGRGGSVTAFRRRIGIDSMKRVLALLALSLGFLLVMIFILMAVQTHHAEDLADIHLDAAVTALHHAPENPPVVRHNDFERLIFEAFSAFGTVGLSMGATTDLAYAGKLVIILLMYIGRVGPLTFIFAVSSMRMKKNLAYTEENISIG